MWFAFTLDVLSVWRGAVFKFMGQNYPKIVHIRGPGRVWGVDTFFPGVVVPRSVSLAEWLGFRGNGDGTGVRSCSKAFVVIVDRF